MREIKFRAWNYKKMVYNVAIRNSLIVNHIDLFTYKDGEANYSIMQFTGMHDKNDNQMYEGDIFKYGNMIGKIVYNQGCFNFNTDKTTMCMRDHQPDQFEIIGNIYENPELINQKL